MLERRSEIFSFQFSISLVSAFELFAHFAFHVLGELATAETALPEGVAHLTLGIGMEEGVETGAELVPEDEAAVLVVAHEVVVTPELVGEVEDLALLGDVGTLDLDGLLVGVAALLLDGDSATDMAGGDEVLLVAHIVGGTVLEIDAAAVGLDALGFGPGEVLVDVVDALLVFAPGAFGIEGVAASPELIHEGLLLLEAGAVDDVVDVAFLGLVGDGGEGFDVVVEGLLVGELGGEGQGDWGGGGDLGSLWVAAEEWEFLEE